MVAGLLLVTLAACGGGGIVGGDDPHATEVEPSQPFPNLASVPDRPDVDRIRAEAPTVQDQLEAERDAALATQATAPAVPDAPGLAGTVYFADASTAVPAADRAALEAIARAQADRDAQVRVVGYASPPAPDADPLQAKIANLRISAARARAVADALEALGVPASAIRTAGVGARDSEAREGLSPEAAARRAEIYLDY